MVTSIVSLSDVKQTLNDTSGSTANDVELQQFIDSMSDVVEYIVGPVRSTSFTEWHPGGKPTVLLRRRPVLTVTSITEYTGTVNYALSEQSPDVAAGFDAYGYFVNYDSGVVERTAYGAPAKFALLPYNAQRIPAFGQTLQNRVGQGRVKVVYTAGRAAVPDWAKRATLELIAVNYQQTQQGGRPKFGKSVSGYDDTVDGGSMVLGYLVPNRVAEMLQPGRQTGGVG